MTMPANKVAAGYVRCSTDMQEDSPDQQKKEIRSFAQEHGYTINEWFVDFGKSGTTFDQRPEFQRLLESVENGHTFGTVICYDESRWGRAIDSEENTYWRVHFRKFGVEVLLVKTSIDPENEFAPMLKAFEGVQASQYSKKLSELTLRGAKDNDIYSSGGTAPYGYQRMAKNLNTGTIRPLPPGEWCVKKKEKVFWSLGDEIEVETVKYIFAERAKGVACVLIASALNERRVPCARRGRGRNRGKKWSAGTVKSIFENPAYYGARAYNRYSSSKIVAAKKKHRLRQGAKSLCRKNPREEWIVVENAHEAIVSKETWEKANRKSGRRGVPQANKNTYFSQYLLTGLIYCTKCGFAFQGWSGKVRGKPYLRYIDGGWKSKRLCKHLSIPKDRLEDFAVQAIKETLSEPEMIRRIEAQVKELLTAQSKPQNGKADLRKALKDNQRRIDNLLNLVEEGAIDPGLVKERLSGLQAERTGLEADLRNLTAGPSNGSSLSPKEIGQAVAQFIVDFEKRFDKAPIEERKALVKKCISRIEVDREKQVARFYVRRIPAVNPQIEEAISERSVMTRASARNRT